MGFDRNGWWPRLHAHAGKLYVAYGNGSVRVAEIEVRGGQIAFVREEFPSAPGSMLGVNWISPGILTAFCELGGDRAQRYTLDVRGQWTWVKTNDSPDLAGGNEYAAAGGHWGSWLAGSRALGVEKRITIDNRVAPGKFGSRLRMADGPNGTWATCASEDFGQVLRANIGGTFEAHPIRVPNYHQAAIAGNGTVLYGGYGPTRGYRSNDEDFDLTIAPWGFEGIGAGSAWIGSDGQTWTATFSWHDYYGKGVIFLRPFGSTDFVLVNRETVDIDVLEDGGNWLIATCDDIGRAAIDVVPFSTPRTRTLIPTFPVCEHVMSLVWAADDSPEWSVFCTIDKDDQGKAIDEAQRKKIPIIGYWDGRDAFNFDEYRTFAAKAKAKGVRSLPMARFYPNQNETETEFGKRVRPIAQAMAKEWPDDWSICYATYRQWNGTSYPLGLQQVIGCWVVCHQLAIEFKARHMEGFALRRPFTPPPTGEDRIVDGVLAFPEFVETMNRMKQATPTRNQFAKQGDAGHKPSPSPSSSVSHSPSASPSAEPPEPDDSFEVFLMAMTAPMTLLRSSLFIKSQNNGERFLYPAPGKPRGWYLSLQQDNKGGVEVKETQTDGGAEQFLWEKGRGLATVGDRTNPVGGGYAVMNDGEPGSGLDDYYNSQK